MFSRDVLVELYRHMEWADAKVWASMPVEDPPDDRLRQLLVHIHLVQRAFLHIWTGAPVREAFRKPDDFASLTDVRAWAQPYYADAHEFIAALTPDRLPRPMMMPWAAQLTQATGQPPGETTLADTCFQVTSHTTYHRGQINIRLREVGREPPLVDYIAWLWFGKPTAEWPSR